MEFEEMENETKKIREYIQQNTMTPARLELIMKRIQKMNENGFIEESHVLADFVLCATLKQYGFGSGIDLYSTMTFWYT